GGDPNDGGGGRGGGTGNNGEDYANRVFNPEDVSQKARILSRPEPQYTEEGRKNQVSGTVVLRAVFSSGGQVTNIRTVSGLPYGLTERAIAAARMIRFSPAMKDGRAVSQYIQIEYNFNLYRVAPSSFTQNKRGVTSVTPLLFCVKCGCLCNYFK